MSRPGRAWPLLRLITLVFNQSATTQILVKTAEWSLDQTLSWSVVGFVLQFFFLSSGFHSSPVLSNQTHLFHLWATVFKLVTSFHSLPVGCVLAHGPAGHSFSATVLIHFCPWSWWICPTWCISLYFSVSMLLSLDHGLWICLPSPLDYCWMIVSLSWRSSSCRDVSRCGDCGLSSSHDIISPVFSFSCGIFCLLLQRILCAPCGEENKWLLEIY